MTLLSYAFKRLVFFTSSIVFIGFLHATADAASIRLLWADLSSNEDGFRIERKPSGGNYATLATVGANVQSYTDANATAGVSYCYVVRSFNTGGVSAPSNSACGTAPASTSGDPVASGSGSTDGTGSTDGSSTGGSSAPTIAVGSYSGSKWKDYSVSLTMKSADNDSIGVMFRYLDNDNYYRFSWHNETKTQQLVKRENGAFKVLAKRTATYTSGRSYSLAISANGSQLKVAVDGATIFTVTDTSFADGTIGLYSSSNQGSSFDNVKVIDLSTEKTLLTEDFSDGNFVGWSIIDDPAAKNGPSLWSVSSGVLLQKSNIGSGTSDALGTYALFTRGSWTDYRFSVKIKSTDNDSIGVMFRYQDDRNYYRFVWDPQEKSRRLEKRVNGVFTSIAHDTVPYVTGQTYQIEIGANKAALQVLVNGASVFAVNDSTFSGGTVALYSRFNSTSIFDDVMVQDLLTKTVLLWDDFNDGNLHAWTIIDDDGTRSGPSEWSVSNGALVETSNIGSDSQLGTFAVY